MRSIEPFFLSFLLVIDPERFPARLNMELFKALQEIVAPTVFTAPASYDGRKNVFSMYQLPLGPTDSREVRVPTCTEHYFFPHLQCPAYNFHSSSLMFLFLPNAFRLLLDDVYPRHTR